MVVDADLRDVEQVPLLYAGSIDAFMQNELLSYAPDAFYNDLYFMLHSIDIKSIL